MGNSQLCQCLKGKNGKLIVWDATCTDTFAPSYIASAASNARAVAALAEEKKITLYVNLVPSHFFVPIAFEASEGVGPSH